MARCLEQGFVRNLEIDYVAPSGATTPIEINATVFRTGKTLNILTLCRDITERKRAALELAESRNHLNTILENVGAAIFMKDSHYRYVYANSAVCKIFGKNRDEIVGHDDSAFFSAESVEEVKKATFAHAGVVHHEMMAAMTPEQLGRAGKGGRRGDQDGLKGAISHEPQET